MITGRSWWQRREGHRPSSKTGKDSDDREDTGQGPVRESRSKYVGTEDLRFIGWVSKDLLGRSWGHVQGTHVN